MISWGIGTKSYEMVAFVTIFAIQISASCDSRSSRINHLYCSVEFLFPFDPISQGVSFMELHVKASCKCFLTCYEAICGFLFSRQVFTAYYECVLC